MTEEANLQPVETLLERYNNLDRERAVADNNLERAKDHLESLQKEADKLFGTADPEQLKKMLADLQKENEKQQREYQNHLDEIEKKLEQVDQDFSHRSDDTDFEDESLEG